MMLKTSLLLSYTLYASLPITDNPNSHIAFGSSSTIALSQLSPNTIFDYQLRYQTNHLNLKLNPHSTIMKPKSFRQRIIKIAIVAATVILSMPALMLYSFKSKIENYSDFWQQLGVTERDGSGNIKQSFLTGYLQYAGARNFRNITVGDRQAVTTDLLNFTKKYISSADFKKAYEVERQSRKPREITRKLRTEEEIRNEFIASTKEGMSNIEKSLKTATGDMKKAFQETYDMYKKQLADYQRPDNEMIPLIAQGEKNQYEFEVKGYEEDVKQWQKTYPAESSLFVKARLQQVLNATAGVDYSAQLAERNNKKYFVKQEYERKPSNWKAGFRAGKEVTETVRTFLQQWVQELN
jgi:hypothetical protein